MVDKTTKRVTMKQVAAEVGVSIGTVSAVLNDGSDKIFFSDATRDRVLATVDRLGYTINTQARSLRLGLSRIIGVALDDLTVTFLADVIHAIARRLQQDGYSVMLLDRPASDGTAKALLQGLFAQRRVDGMVLAGSAGLLSDDDLVDLAEANVPIVLVEREAAGARIPSVHVDNESGGKLAGAHLLGRGVRRLALITGPMGGMMTQQRLAGCRMATEDQDLSWQDVRIVEGDWQLQSGYEAMRELLNARTPPDGVFAFNDAMAMGAMRAIHDHGLRMPGDIAVIGFDDIEFAKFATPTLTTVRQPARLMGKKAAELTLGLLEERAPEQLRVVLPPKLIVRESA